MPIHRLMMLGCMPLAIGMLASGVARAPTLRPVATARRVPAHAFRAAATLPAPAVEAVAREDAWIKSLDLGAFKAEVRALGDRLEREQGPADVDHLQKLIRWSNICAAVGIGTMWLAPNPVSIIALSTWTFSRWTMIAHHTCHGGYNRQDDGSGRFTSIGFAVGSIFVRVRDWLDWMLPEAWNIEHNNLHHFRTGEDGDPDLVERNVEMLREAPIPRILKYAAVGILAGIWKWYYYAPNTYKQLRVHEMKRNGEAIPADVDPQAAFALPTFLMEPKDNAALGVHFGDFIRRVIGPFVLCRFLLLPAPLLLFGKKFFVNALMNLALADVLSNLHAFLAIATNHAGDDLYRFETSVAPKSGSFYMRQVTSSVNFRTGGDVNDFLHGWLNYQIEHHVWPQLSMLSYQKGAPELKAICAKHGVPYVQQSVFKRLKKTADIMVGAASMRRFRREWEFKGDEFKWK